MMGRVIPIVLILLIPSASYAFHAVEEIGSLRVEVFAPDWVWQKGEAKSPMGADIHTLLIAENRGLDDSYIHVVYTAPGSTQDFPFNGGEYLAFPSLSDRQQIFPGNMMGRLRSAFYTRQIPPGQSISVSFPGCHASSKKIPGVYGFRIEVKCFEKPVMENVRLIGEQTITIPIRTIRGAAVSDSLWAKLLPALIGLAWCAVVTVFMRRYVRPGTWRRTFAPEMGEGPN